MPLDRSPDVSRIDVRGLNKTFQLAGTAIEAVRGVSFSVRRGEFVALLGPSGSGKSTVLNMIATLVRPSGGQILIDGTPIGGYVELWQLDRSGRLDELLAA